VAVDTPLRQLFDYRLTPQTAVRPGMRVRVPFGRREVVGLVMRLTATTDVPQAKLRDVGELLDASPLLGSADLKLLEWAANYYHHPIGEVVATALPKGLRVLRKRAARRAPAAEHPVSTAFAAGDPPLALSRAQQAALQALQGASGASNFLLDGVTGSGKTEVYLGRRGGSDGSLSGRLGG
jgi:primosomal protein N' (replication factor Y)